MLMNKESTFNICDLVETPTTIHISLNFTTFGHENLGLIWGAPIIITLKIHILFI